MYKAVAYYSAHHSWIEGRRDEQSAKDQNDADNKLSGIGRSNHGLVWRIYLALWGIFTLYSAVLGVYSFGDVLSPEYAALELSLSTY